MPPTRTIPPAKAVKTERTHEENQERAYIAASRRSDRSLEARVESARRASEIHKRRTGRSLRVTEQDVINEEMYEEEDDDLPMQYRRLTAHLQTGSADFNRRLTAYLTNQVAMRAAVEQMATNPYTQQFQGAAAYTQPHPNMFHSPISNQTSLQSPTGLYRHAPYPSPHHANFRQHHGRAYSAVVVPHAAHTPPTPGHESTDHRRMSTPAVLPPQIDTQHNNPDFDYLRQTQSAQLPQGQFQPYWQDMNPFTSSLPPESQQMLAGAPALENNDAFSASLLHGSEQFTTSPYYPWGSGVAQQQMKNVAMPSSSYQGMSTTLAPAALTSQAESVINTPCSNPSTAIEGTSSGGEFDPLGLNHLNLPEKEESSPFEIPSGQITPGESFWTNFVQDGGWTEEPNFPT